MGERIDLLSLTPLGLRDLLAEWGEPSFRARQLERWIYESLSRDFDAMSNLPQSLRDRLKSSTEIGSLIPVAERSSTDGLTRKVLFELADHQTVESVLMLYVDAPEGTEFGGGESNQGNAQRRTVCVSTQVGCPIGCPFCATGNAGFVRNLTAGEIIAQVLYLARQGREEGFESMPVTNVVIMGMGEPLMKFDVTWQAVEALTDSGRYGLGSRRITISTSGLVPGINRLAKSRSQVNLAVSLHAADDELRDVLVPINRRYPIRDLMNACRDYVEQTHRRLTFEYALMEGVNDSVDQARSVALLLKGLLCHVNLIPINPTSSTKYRRPSYERVKRFERVIAEVGISTTLRVEKGIEIAAGCGQLRQRDAKRREASAAPLPIVA